MLVDMGDIGDLVDRIQALVAHKRRNGREVSFEAVAVLVAAAVVSADLQLISERLARMVDDEPYVPKKSLFTDEEDGE